MAPSDTLLDLLSGTQSLDLGCRKSSEDKVRAAEGQPGFGIALVRAAISQGGSLELRQLAALLLKQFIKNHWTTAADTFVDPVIEDEEKAQIRMELPSGLADPSSKLRTAVSMAVVSIAKWDVPERWPTLIGNLLGAITSRQRAELVSGAIRCLSMLVDEIDEEQSTKMVPVLLPELLNILRQPHTYDSSVQRRAVATMRGLSVNCAHAQGSYKVQARTALLAQLQPWLQQFCEVLSQPQKAGSAEHIGALKMEVLRTLVFLFSNFGKTVQPAAGPVLQHCWTLLTECYPLYQTTVIVPASSSEGGEVDSEGDTTDLSSLISQLVEFLLTLASSSRFQSLLAGSLEQLVYVAIGYLQISGEQEKGWELDVNSYIADEEELIFAVRASVCLLLDQLFTSFPGAASAALAHAVQRRLQEAAELQQKGDPSWWKLREAGLLAVWASSEYLLEADSSPHFQVPAVLDSVLQQDLRDEVHIFLQSRAFSVMAKFAEAIDSHRILPSLQRATAGLSGSKHPVVQVGACRAITELVGKANAEVLSPLLQSIYSGLGVLLAESEEEALSLALLALEAVVKAAPGAAAAWQQHVTPSLLHLWRTHVADPVLSLAVIDVFEALAAIPEALPDLQAAVVPVLVDVAGSSSGNDPGLIESALDLAIGLLRPSTQQAAAAVHAAFSGTVMSLLRGHDDAGVLQSCCEYIRLLINRGGEAIFSFGGSDPDATIREIVTALKRLLLPEMGDSAPLFVGQVLVAILRAAPQRGVVALAEILPAVVTKLAEANSSPLIVALLSVFAQLAHTSPVQLIEYLAAAPAPGGSGRALDLLLQIWTERALEFKGAHDIKLSTSALATLLSTCHPALTSVQVKGRRLDVDSGIRTRSKAAHQQEHWQWVPATAKLFALLADTLIEAKEGKLEGEDDDDEWESASGSDEEGSVATSSQAPPEVAAMFKGVVKAAMDDSSDAPFEEEGPFSGIDLVELVGRQLKSLAQQDKQLFESCCSLLSPMQLQAVQACF